MNPVEIEEAISILAEQPFDGEEFPFAFLEAFGNKKATIAKLRKGTSNSSDVGGVLQRNNIHMKVAPAGEVSNALNELRKSPATTKAKAKFILATDGTDFEAEDLTSGETVACPYTEFPNHFGFFLALAGISTVKQIRESAFDIRATSRLNRMYVELLKDNPDWDTQERRHDMNHFMARLIFCFFAEDTEIFRGENLFTSTVDRMSARDSSDTHEVISELFRAMNTKPADRSAENIRNWADKFPYVNGGLFSGSTDVPRFSKIARSYLLHIGNLDWKQINPDIFGSMIQAVADDEERGALGMHYTSVPNILKVLNPLFLDELREKLEEAGDNSRKLLNLRNRMARIRVFDPACGSGNFLVIAYKEMRAIEAEINQRRGEPDRKSDIPLTNFRGIEIRDFPAEIARLALIIAEYQCDVLYRGQKEALQDVLPLNAMNWITCGNALRLDWLSICPPTGTDVKLNADDLLSTPLEQAEIDFENEGGETYICGNPPYLGSTWQDSEQKCDLTALFSGKLKNWKTLDYVSGWFVKAAEYGTKTESRTAFVATNSIVQGQQVALLWPVIYDTGAKIFFAHTNFKWRNLASHNAGVTVVIIGITNRPEGRKTLFSESDNGTVEARDISSINAYLVPGPDILVRKSSKPINKLPEMKFGNKPVDGGYLLLSAGEVEKLGLSEFQKRLFIRKNLGGAEFIRGVERYCLWIEDDNLSSALEIPGIKSRVDAVRKKRLASTDKAANDMAARAHQMREMNIGSNHTIVVAAISSENRHFLPCGLIDNQTTVNNKNYALYDAPLWNMALIASRLHWVWIGTVCVRMRTDFSYSNTLGWNTFPVPTLTEKNRADLTRCAEGILLAREAHFPATIADLYDPEKMPENLRAAHDRNDDTLERIYIGRRFKNDTERLEKLFEMYTKMTSKKESGPKSKAV
ncbi:class I SAM-dependent DNA methyltransferase [Parvularcula marina]|uniref:class I SAM-dependent DNA methyltransferase n=1 Tax=Parvularcula marina TaxID=2292771 RepID=UPI003518FCA1